MTKGDPPAAAGSLPAQSTALGSLTVEPHSVHFASQDGEVSVRVDPYLHNNTEAGQLRAWIKIPLGVRRNAGAVVFEREEQRGEEHWFVFRMVRPEGGTITGHAPPTTPRTRQRGMDRDGLSQLWLRLSAALAYLWPTPFLPSAPFAESQLTHFW